MDSGNTQSELIVRDLQNLYEIMREKKLLMKELAKQVIRLYEAQIENPSERDDFEEYNDLLINNLDIIMKGFRLSEQFCNIRGPGQFDEEKLYSASIQSLAGGSAKRKQRSKQRSRR